MPTLGKAVKGQAKVKDDPLLLEHEALKQQEVRRKQEVLLRARLHELMIEEEEMSRTSEKDIQGRWMDILRKQKHKELISEVEVLRHQFDKTLDRKNAVIAMLTQDLEEAEEQYRLALRTHMSNIDGLVDLQNRRTTDLDIEFERDLMELKRDFELEKAEMERRHAHERDDLQLVLSNMLAEAEREDRRLQEETSESHDTAIEKMDEEKKQMQGELSKLNELLRNQINEKYDEFVNNAQVQMKEYMEFTKRDEETAETIASQMRKIQKLQESIGNWKANLSNNIRECEERNNKMREEREATARHFKALKAKMHQWRRLQEKRLAELVGQTRGTKVALDEVVSTAEKILKFVELCGPMETERERILGFDSDVAFDEVQTEVKERLSRQMQLDIVKQQAKNDNADAGQAADVPEARLVSQEQLFETTGTNVGASYRPSDTLIGVTAGSSGTHERNILDRFWVRFNKVLLDNAAIAQEKYHLQHENQKLRSLLKQYLDGISVSHDVMGQSNNLLQTSRVKAVVGGLPNSSGPTSKGQMITVQEGNKIFVENARQRAF